jgi:hypothetical protein
MDALVEQDYEALVTAIGNMACLLMDKQEGFLPIAAAIDSSGKLSHIGGDMGTEHPDPKELFEFLVDALSESLENKTHRAFAVAIDTRERSKSDPKSFTDKIYIALNHSAGEPKALAIPYSKKSGKHVLEL